MIHELPPPKYPRTRVYSQHYDEALWDSDCDTGTPEEFLIASKFEWLPVVRDYAPNKRWSGRLVRRGSGVQVCQNSDFLEYLLAWANPFAEAKEDVQ